MSCNVYPFTTFTINVIQVLNKMIWTFYVKPPSLPTIAQYTKQKIGHFPTLNKIFLQMKFLASERKQQMPNKVQEPAYEN